MKTTLLQKSTCAALLIGVLASSAGAGAIRSAEKSDGYHAILLGRDTGTLSELRDQLDKRCGFHALASGNLSDGTLRSWVNQVHMRTGGVSLVFVSGTLTPELKIDDLPLETVIQRVCRLQSDECLIVVDANGEEQPEDQNLKERIRQIISQYATTASPVIHVMWNDARQSRVRERLVQRLVHAANSQNGRDLTMSRLRDEPEFEKAVTIRNGEGEVSLVRRRPIVIDEVIQDVADEVAEALRKNEQFVVCVPDVVLGKNTGVDVTENLPGQHYGALLKRFAKQLRAELCRRSQAYYEVMSDELLRDMLNESKLTPRVLRRPQVTSLYRVMAENGIPAAAAGDDVACVIVEVRHDPDDPSRMTFSTLVRSLREGSQLHTCHKTALLTESDWGEIGVSAINRTAIARYMPVGTNSLMQKPLKSQKPQKTVEQLYAVMPPVARDLFEEEDLHATKAVVQELSESDIHPLRHDRFPLTVSILSRDGEKQILFSDDGKHAWVTFQKDDTYKIVIENKSNNPVFMRLLVDGLNTLPDYPLTERSGQSEVIRKDRRAELAPAQIASLTNARAWFCKPGLWTIGGFFKEVSGNSFSRYGKFTITDAAASEAFNKGYRKDIGVITAAFYVPLIRPKDLAPGEQLGTVAGETETAKVETFQGNSIPGELLTIVHIRYAAEAPVEPRNAEITSNRD